MVVAETEVKLAVMVAVPLPLVVAKPELLTTQTWLLDEAQFTQGVMS